MTKLREESILEEISIQESLKNTEYGEQTSVTSTDEEFDLGSSDPGFVVSEPYKVMFELDNMSGKELYLELCEASYNVSSMLIGDNWQCIAFLQHSEYMENGELSDEVLDFNKDSFAGGAYYNTETKELVFAYRGSEPDIDDWVKNDFYGFGADDVPDQFENTYKFFNLVINKIKEGSVFVDSKGNQIDINDVNKITFTGNSLVCRLGETQQKLFSMWHNSTKTIRVA